MAIKLKKCLSTKISYAQNLWKEISGIARECGVEYAAKLLHAKYLHNRDDVKVIIPPKEKNASLVSLTLGIGNDVSAETRLRSAFPQVQFYGADPILEDGKPFEAIGKYLQVVGVSKSGGVVRGSVLINGKYVWRNILTVTMPELLKIFKLKTIDYLLIDVEGPEYDILPDIVLNKDFNDTTICQINVEVHGPLKKYNVTEADFDKILYAIVSRKSPYIPLWIPPRSAHQRFLLVNWQNLYCVRQFFSHWC
uniref:Methyltransf_21 domain-containing protein n=1 Tax=Syphacia muris TaxID=451379 RepID=A0A0N5AGC1_9BILA